MFKIVFCYLILITSALAGALPEVTLKAEENVIKHSDHVFEAIFVDKKIKYFHNNKPIERKKLDKLGFDKASFEITINLLITKVIKGDLKKHQIHTIQFTDFFGSECPHLPGYGNYKLKQVYYLNINKDDKEYQYRTVRESKDLETLTKTTKITGELGLRIGRIVELEGVRSKLKEADPFEYEEFGFQIQKLNKKKCWHIIKEFKLDDEIARNGETLPKHGAKFKVKGYESIIVHPFEESELKGLAQINDEYPQFYNHGIFSFVFIVTEILPVNE